ncbi:MULTISPECIES: protein phosphatase 2C domain-containing protein [unclassified Microcoleus]|uniref:protein phosphatase 2C domain-containing protein n=1 Tax=unclassified Microcoleus TaxID=2642155 RepID=UPI002FCF8964
MKFEAFSISETGPRSSNEDAVGLWRPTVNTLAAAVADGLGGMGGGGAASHIAIRTLEETFRDTVSEEDALTAARKAHEAILLEQQTQAELRHMATTLTAGFFSGGRLTGVHCGDSRASIARRQGIMRLTSDHSEGERLFRAGKLSKEELRDYPRQNILDSALGVHKNLQIDSFACDIFIGDKVFFTTDGIHEKVPLREMRQIAEQHSDPKAFVTEMAAIVSGRDPSDNFSIAAVFVI